MAENRLSDLEREAVSILVERAINARVTEINMADKIPSVRALGPALQKVFDKLEDTAHKKIADIEAMGDRGASVVSKFDTPIKDANDAFAELEKALEASSNGGPL